MKLMIGQVYLEKLADDQAKKNNKSSAGGKKKKKPLSLNNMNSKELDRLVSKTEPTRAETGSLVGGLTGSTLGALAAGIAAGRSGLGAPGVFGGALAGGLGGGALGSSAGYGIGHLLRKPGTNSEGQDLIIDDVGHKFEPRSAVGTIAGNSVPRVFMF